MPSCHLDGLNPKSDFTPQPLGNQPTVGVVVLTQGNRPDELRQACQSVFEQRGVQLQVVIVGNAWDPSDFVDSLKQPCVQALFLPKNIGIPAGRNRGAALLSGQWVSFVDDDAQLSSSTFVMDCLDIFAQDSRIGLLQPRVCDPNGEPSPRRWTPRIRVGDPTRSSAVFSILEATVMLPRQVFDATGGWAEPFFYAHEGIELAWHVWDQGKIVWYAGNLTTYHPLVSPSRHTSYYRLNARNRVWLAKRNPPLVFIPLYVGSWTGIQIIRSLKHPARLKAWFSGWFEGWKESAGVRKPLKFKTIWTMTKRGRPPII